MKKTICAIFCSTVIFFIFHATACADDFSNKAISIFQEYLKLNNEWSAAFLSGDSSVQREKGKLLAAKKDEYSNILRSLPGKYCADPQIDLLREFIKTLIGTTDEYPTYVFAELYACDTDRVIMELMSLAPDDKRKIFEDLDWGFKNITYKIESLPNFKELSDRIKKLKKEIRGK